MRNDKKTEAVVWLNKRETKCQITFQNDIIESKGIEPNEFGHATKEGL
jgi:hypothetical protein